MNLYFIIKKMDKIVMSKGLLVVANPKTITIQPSDKPTDNDLLYLQLHLALRSFIVSFSYLFSYKLYSLQLHCLVLVQSLLS